MTAMQEALRALDRLPDDASWDQLTYEIYVRQKLAKGVRAAEEGRVLSHQEVERRFARTVGHLSNRST